MAGSVWPLLLPGSKAKASDVENKFAWLEGDIVPMSGGTRADATYDMGSEPFRWRDGWFSRSLSLGSGGAAAPSIVIQEDGDTGLFFSGINELAAVAGEVTAWTVNGAGQSLITDGSIPTPPLSFLNDQTTGIYRVGTGTAAIVNNGAATLRIDSAGRITKPVNPAFMAVWATAATFLPAGLNTLTAWLEAYDRSDNFSDGVFRAPVTGIYKFSIGYGDTRNSGSMTSIHLTLVTTARSYGARIGAQDNASSVNEIGKAFTVLADMTANDTAYLMVTVVAASFSTTSYAVDGFNSVMSTNNTFFSGRLAG